LTFAEETIILLKNGSEIKHGGAPGAFESEFRYMETILEEVRRIIAGSNISLESLENLMDKLQQLRYVITSAEGIGLCFYLCLFVSLSVCLSLCLFARLLKKL